MLSFEETLLKVWEDPDYAESLYHHYLDRNLAGAAERFYQSAEFAEVKRLIGSHLSLAGSKVLDLGAGRGIASYAFAKSGVQKVYALEPDQSDIVGQGAIRSLTAGLPVEILAAFGEGIPIGDGELDIVYARQVLHHVRDLPHVLRECARILRTGGIFMACREHIADDDEQLAIFLKTHPMNRFTGEENAYPVERYTDAITGAGFKLLHVFTTYDTIINAYPTARTKDELQRLPEAMLERKLGKLGVVVSYVPGVKNMVWQRLKRPVPGRGYSFMAIKP